MSSCVGVPAGYYQGCNTCEGYISCVGDILHNMPCIATFVWDDNVKNCVVAGSGGSSATCPEPTGRFNGAKQVPCILNKID